MVRWVASFWILCFCASLPGQTVSTEILGLVTDPTGAVIPGATVTVNRVATGDVRTATTNETGNYIFPLLESASTKSPARPRDSRRRCAATSCSSCNQKARIDFQMQVGNR